MDYPQIIKTVNQIVYMWDKYPWDLIMNVKNYCLILYEKYKMTTC